MSAKIAIIGAGSVGATIAYACIIRAVSKHIALYDVQKTKVDAEVQAQVSKLTGGLGLPPGFKLPF